MQDKSDAQEQTTCEVSEELLVNLVGGKSNNGWLEMRGKNIV